jgi:uncharacterized protein (TIGR03382 family)
MLVGDDLLAGKEASASLALSLPAAVWGKSIEFVVDIIDSAGNAGRETLPALIGLNGEIQFAIEGGPDEGPTAETPGPVADGGCSVRSRPTSKEGAAALLAIAAAALGAATGRRRRPRPRD